MNRNQDQYKQSSEDPKKTPQYKQHTSHTSNPEWFINPNENLSSRVEIPFTFQHDKQTPTSSNPNQSNNQFHSFIKIKNTPILYLDISDETSQEKLICEGLKTENSNLKIIAEKDETKLAGIQSENDKLKTEMNSWEQDYLSKTQQLNQLIESLNKKEVIYTTQILNNKKYLQKTDNMIKKWIFNFEELQDTGLKTDDNTNTNTISNLNEHSEKCQNENSETLKKKFEIEVKNDMKIKACLMHDITDFMKFQKMLTNSKQASIEKIKTILIDVLNDLTFDILLYGSYGSDTALDWSNVNLLLNFPQDSTLDPKILIQLIFMKIKDLPFIQGIDIVNSTELNNGSHSAFKHYSYWTNFTPKIKFYVNEQYNNLVFEIAFHFGTTSAYYLKTINLINHYSEMFPIFKSWLVCLKHWLYNCSWWSNENGNLNSYTLAIMLIKYLKSLEVTPSWSDAFLEFLKFYGHNSDNSKRIISIQEEISTDNFGIYSNSNHELIVIDPFNPGNNIADKTFKFENVKVAFMVAYFAAKDNCECSCHYDNNNQITEAIELNVLNKIFKAVKRLSNVNINNSNNDN